MDSVMSLSPEGKVGIPSRPCVLDTGEKTFGWIVAKRQMRKPRLKRTNYEPNSQGDCITDNVCVSLFLAHCRRTENLLSPKERRTSVFLQ